MEALLRLKKEFTICSDRKSMMKRSSKRKKRSILLLSQNTDSQISEVSIQNEIAQCYIGLGKVQKGIELLKKYNVSGVHNALIAFTLAGNEHSDTNTSGSGLEDAVPFMTDAFVSVISDAIRTMLAYANYYFRKGDYVSSREAFLWLIDLLERVKMDQNSSCYVDKVIAPCYSGCATCSLLLGETKKVEPYMKRAYQAAVRFDSVPVYQIGNMRFCIGDIQNETAYDDLGETAMEAVLKQITQENGNEQLLNIWNKIVNEETCGGAK